LNYAVAVVDESAKKVRLDLGNALPVNPSAGDVANLGPIEVVCDAGSANPLSLGPINYTGLRWYESTAGIVELPDGRLLTAAELALVQTRPLTVTVGATHTAALVEHPQGLHVRADDAVWRLNGVNPVQQTAAMRGWGTAVVPPAVVSNFNDIRGQLHYDYCNPPATRVLDLSLPTTPSATLSLEAPLQHLRPERPSRRSIAQVQLKGVSVPTDFSYTVRVFLYPAAVPFEPDSNDFQARYLADRFTVWKDDVSSHAGGIDVNLDVSRVYESLAGGANSARSLKVSFDFARIDRGKSTRVAWGTPGIEIRSARLVVNPPLFHGKK
jgi:hypothetical protein